MSTGDGFAGVFFCLGRFDREGGVPRADTPTKCTDYCRAAWLNGWNEADAEAGQNVVPSPSKGRLSRIFAPAIAR